MDDLLWVTIIGFALIAVVVGTAASAILAKIKAIREELNRYKSRSFAEGVLTQLAEIERVTGNVRCAVGIE